MAMRIAVLPGDGIGRKVTAQAVKAAGVPDNAAPIERAVRAVVAALT